MLCFLNGLRGLLKGSKPIKQKKPKKPGNSENWISKAKGLFDSKNPETEKPETSKNSLENVFEPQKTLKILEVADYVVWFCFDRVDPPTRLTLNCYLWLMNEYTLRTTGNPIASDAVFDLDGRYLECETIKREFFPGLFVPYTKHPDTAYMERISGILKLDWFLEGLMKFNIENPFRLLELCREKDFDLVYYNLIDCLK